jgi:outer membrane protein assembly factor BamA
MEMKKNIVSLTIVCLASLLVSSTLTAAESTDLNAIKSALTIESIVCEGNETSDCDFITKKFYQQSGDILDPSKVSDAKLRLGTMDQFHHVDVHLEKGSVRGKVIVVFEVKEANQIQYGISGGKSRSIQHTKQTICESISNCAYSDNRSTDDSNSVGISRTNFNFLGSGRTLTTSASTSYSTYHSSSIYDASELSDSSFPSRNRKANSTSRGLGLGIGYHDEHFLDTPNYELVANVGAFARKSEYSHLTFYPDSSDVEQEQKQNESSYESVSGSFALNKRFARYSRIGVSTGVDIYSSSNSASPEINSVSLYYSFDTFNDTLFATRGDSFSTGIHFSDDSKNIYLNYAKVYSISDDKVMDFSFGGGHNMSKMKNSNSIGTTISLKSNNGTNYLYSGWEVGLSAGLIDYSGDWESSKNLFASYIHQTGSMTYKFSLGYRE